MRLSKDRSYEKIEGSKKYIVNDIFIFLFLLAIGLWLLVVLIQANKTPGYQILFSKNHAYDCNEGWYDDHGNVYSLDEIYFDSQHIDKTFTFHYDIPADLKISSNDGICFFSRGLDYSVSITAAPENEYYDSEDFGSRHLQDYSQNSAGMAGEDIGIVAHVVPLECTDAGNTINMEITPRDFTAYMVNMSIDDASDYTFSIIRTRMPMFIASLVIVFWGLVYMLYNAFAIGRTRDEKVAAYAIGLICLFMGLILLIETQMIQILTGKPELYSTMKYMLVLIVGFPLALKIDAQTKVPHKHFSYAIGVIVLILIVVESLGTFFIDKAFYKFYYFAAGVLLFDFIAAIYFGIKDIFYCWKKPDCMSTMFSHFADIAMYIIFLVDLHIYLSYSTHVTDWGRLIRIGYIFYILVMIVRMFRHSIKSNKAALLVEQYRKEARTDALTGIQNKAAFREKEIAITDELWNEDQTVDDCRFGVMVFDLNFLKKVNDTMGHAMGDKYIIMASKHISEAVGELGEVYRVGGDEFMSFVFENNPEKACQDIIDTLTRKIAVYNNNHPSDTPLSIAYGFSICTSGSHHSITYAEKKADQRMYECKKAMRALRV